MKKSVETEIKNKIRQHMSAGLDLSVFLAEIGWEDWMNEFTTAAEGEEISEHESNEIDAFIVSLWKEVETEDE